MPSRSHVMAEDHDVLPTVEDVLSIFNDLLMAVFRNGFCLEMPPEFGSVRPAGPLAVEDGLQRQHQRYGTLAQTMQLIHPMK